MSKFSFLLAHIYPDATEFSQFHSFHVSHIVSQSAPHIVNEVHLRFACA